jgi:hypothetical protein
MKHGICCDDKHKWPSILDRQAVSCIVLRRIVLLWIIPNSTLKLYLQTSFSIVTRATRKNSRIFRLIYFCAVNTWKNNLCLGIWHWQGSECISYLLFVQVRHGTPFIQPVFSRTNDVFCKHCTFMTFRLYEKRVKSTLHQNAHILKLLFSSLLCIFLWHDYFCRSLTDWFRDN